MKTSLKCSGDPTPRSIIILYVCANIYTKYISVAHLYCSSKPYVFCKIVLIPEKLRCLFCIISIMLLLCAAVVEKSWFLSSDKNEWNTAWREKLPDGNNRLGFFYALKCSNEISLMDNDLFTPY